MAARRGKRGCFFRRPTAAGAPGWEERQADMADGASKLGPSPRAAIAWAQQPQQPQPGLPVAARLRGAGTGACGGGQAHTPPASIARRAHGEGYAGVMMDHPGKRVNVKAELRAWTHAFQQSDLALVIFDPGERRIVAVNRAFARRRGYTPDEMVGLDADLLYPASQRRVWREQRSEIDRQAHAVIESEHVTRDGRRFPVLLDVSVVHDSDGRPRRVVTHALDITARKRVERGLRLAETAFQAQAPLMLTDRRGRIDRVNPAFVALTGYADADTRGRGLDLLGWALDDPPLVAARADAERGEAVQREVWLHTRRGSSRVVRLRVAAITGEAGAADQYLWSMTDLSGERNAMADIERLTFFDALTGLPNQRFLRERLRRAVSDGAARRVLLVLDLDRFQRVNDLYGHAAGDRLLAQVAARLQPATIGCAALARLGGGTFALLAQAASDAVTGFDALAAGWADRIHAGLAEPFELGRARRVVMTAAIGWAALAPDPAAYDDALREAEIALHQAKADGRNGVRGFDPSMQESLETRALITQELEDAMARGELALHLQPLVDASDRIIGAEALLRWMRPDGRGIGPDVFIPIAEETGLIQALGRWTLERGCAQLAAWASTHATEQLVLALNVSARQLADPNFIGHVRGAIAVTGARADRLTLEITETAVLTDLEDATHKLAQLRAMGIRIALDDFGTGYSSLVHLATLPFDEIKIDRSFIARVPGVVRDAHMVEALVGLAHRLGLQVVAEGVETVAQHRFLRRIGCDAYQGYLFAKAAPPKRFLTMLEAANDVARVQADDWARVARPDPTAGGMVGRRVQR